MKNPIKKYTMFVVQNKFIINEAIHHKNQCLKNKGDGGFRKPNFFLLLRNRFVLQPSPSFFYSPNFFKMQNKSKKSILRPNNSKAEIHDLKLQRLQLQEQLRHVKVLGDVFMHFICDLGSQVEFKPEDLGQLHTTYLTSVHLIEKYKH